MEEAKTGGLQLVDGLKLYIEPTVVLLPSRIDENVEARFLSGGTSKRGSDSDEGLKNFSKVLPKKY
ncbi:hypothetical protein L228DRAFT_242948 [Xylona heveae TC161]|uniref:Uncharacterized protein n=1 Tax=Xylona heveae (strain CBS 132557 / TC161) TaxID=1328760 RepID=A0A165JP22_XYLHT|nr:hypothetical protein L228DRAFT_242948 [Xylona heveae TC161]KZF26469.1 hypothetical protein L228DRAFT_242948 [Xylona heveae TC161]